MTIRSSERDIGIDALEEVFGVDEDTRDRPDTDLLARMRSRYPTEREFDSMLARKALKRAEPPRRAATLEQLSEQLDAFLRDHVDGPYTVSRQRWLSGGASKIQLAFALTWNDPALGLTTTDMVLRMEPQESLNTTSRYREFQIVNALAGVLPVPRAFWVDQEGEWFSEPALIYAFTEGVTTPRGVEGRPSGVGSDFGPHLRESLGAQFVHHLATLHTFDVTGQDLAAFDTPRVGSTESALWQLNRARRVWEEDRGEELPLLEVAANWLERNLPELDTVSLLHGDYRAGNFLFDEDRRQITSWLDWERGYLGDRHRDLAWATLPQFGTYAKDGTTFLVSGLIALDEFYARYQELSGLSIDPSRIRYYRILNTYQLVVSTLGSAYRVVKLGKSHQDVLLAWLEGVVYSLADELRLALLEGN